MFKMLRIPIILLIVLNLSGCAGILVYSEKEVDFGEGVILSEDRGFVKMRETSDGWPSKEDVRAKWGEPDEAISADDIDIWCYKKGLTWVGIVPMAMLIPIPLFCENGDAVRFLSSFQPDIFSI
jgi:hypothetical protein